MENIMVIPNKHQIKIVDFGLSNIWTPDCPLRTHCGSPEYAAPELFLVGRHYGPEVDLRSLGVILYGMVTGRLPFMSTRNEVLTSQEKRQKLLAQINRGLTNTHKKELQNLSADLRHLISNLLIPSASERINTETLLSHPWITNRQKRKIKINATVRPNPSWQSSVINDLAKMLQTDPESVSFEIKSNRYGEIGGMYNIKKYLQTLQSNKIETENSSKLPLSARDVNLTNSLRNVTKNTVKSTGTTNLRQFSMGSINSAKGVKEDKKKISIHDTPIDNRKRQTSYQVTSRIPHTARTTPVGYNTPTRILSPPSKLIKNTSSKNYQSTSRQPQISLIKKSGSDESRKQPRTQFSSIPRPINTCPLHSRLNIETSYHQTHNQWTISNNSQKYSRLTGTYGVRRPFNQRPATVHPKLKVHNEENDILAKFYKSVMTLSGPRSTLKSTTSTLAKNFDREYRGAIIFRVLDRVRFGV